MHYLTSNDLEWFFRPLRTDKVNRYPLTNLGVDENDNSLIIEIAVAGFGKKDVKLDLKGNVLHIIGNKLKNLDEEKVNYIQRHISISEFERTIVLHDNYVGGDITANLEDGILTIKVSSKIPSVKEIPIL
jgi:HSP20 family protein